MQSKKLTGINFYGVLRGIDKDVLLKIKRTKITGIKIKPNPIIFRKTGIEVVPAFVYALCPPHPMFKSKECDYKMVVYGDLSLPGALEIMGERDSDVKKIYESINSQ